MEYVSMMSVLAAALKCTIIPQRISPSVRRSHPGSPSLITDEALIVPDSPAAISPVEKVITLIPSS
jgi:hypothetical protein